MSNEPRKLARLEDRTLSTSIESNMTTETGGPAFPQPDMVDDGALIAQGSSGMTLRDYFAAKSMQATRAADWHEDMMSANDAAQIAYQDADAMLEARKK